MGQIRVMLADDEETVLDALTSLLDGEEEISVVGAGHDVDDAIAIAASKRPDVALLDVHMPRGGGPRAAREITRVSPDTELIALSANDDPNDIGAMLQAGAGAYLVKGKGSQEIVDAIHRSVEESGGRTRWTALLPGALDARASGSRARLRRIEAAVRGEGLEVVYQPVYHLRDGRAVGAEALSRFSAVPARRPDVWFAEADEVGLGIELEITAARLALEGLDQLDDSMVIGVNVSPDTCCSPELRELLGSVQASRVVLEVTENDPVADYDRLESALAPLRAKGVGLAIDDTCSGFASLRHVLYLGPGTIKLDITLTRGVESDSARRSLVEAIVGFAPSVGAEVLAEGIESAEQCNALMDAGVQLGQGFFLARPAPLPRAGVWPAWTDGDADAARPSSASSRQMSVV